MYIKYSNRMYSCLVRNENSSDLIELYMLGLDDLGQSMHNVEKQELVLVDKWY